MDNEKDPFQRVKYRALVYGTTIISGKIHHFDVLSKDDSQKLLKGHLVGRVSGRLVVCESVPDRQSSLSQIDIDLISANGKKFGVGDDQKELLQVDAMKEFVLDEQRKLAEFGQTYTGYCI